MSRRDIRQMLLTPKKRLQDRPWLLPVLMGAALVGGVGLGMGVGLWATGDRPAVVETAAVAPAAPIDRPARRDEMLAPPSSEDRFRPMVPVPDARPGGPADDGVYRGMEEEGEAHEAVEAARPIPVVATAALAVPAPAVVAEPKAERIAFATPAWQRNAVPPPRTGGLPMIAVVIDDMGVDKKRSDRVARLRAPLTLSWLTYADDLADQTASARKHGHELLLHVPMEPQGQRYDPGPDVLEVGLSAEEVRRRLVWGLGRFDGFVGINNHMGSRFTGDTAGMAVVMEELRRRGLLFLDSVTTQKSVGPQLARRFAIPFAERHVFLDNEPSLGAVRAQLGKLEAYARKHGAAIAIGHPYDATIEALAGWLPGLESRGFVLVPVSAVVRAKPPA